VEGLGIHAVLPLNFFSAVRTQSALGGYSKIHLARCAKCCRTISAPKSPVHGVLSLSDAGSDGNEEYRECCDSRHAQDHEVKGHTVQNSVPSPPERRMENLTPAGRLPIRLRKRQEVRDVTHLVSRQLIVADQGRCLERLNSLRSDGRDGREFFRDFEYR
jgi:hypothetical protein